LIFLTLLVYNLLMTCNVTTTGYVTTSLWQFYAILRCNSYCKTYGMPKCEYNCSVFCLNSETCTGGLHRPKHVDLFK